MLANNCSRLEQLSNELIFDIFEYLDGYDLYQSFYGLNHRINTLLQSARLYILTDSTKTDETIWSILKPSINRAQIRFLFITGNIDINIRFLPFYHQNVSSIRLLDISVSCLDRICEQFPDDNHVKSLSVQQKYEGQYDQDKSIGHTILVKYAQQLRSLVNLALSPCTYQNGFDFSPVIFPSLRHLCIRNHCMSADLIQFLNENTPNLRSFKFIGYYPIMHPTITPVKHIEELHISVNVNLATLRNTLSYFPGLRRIHFEWRCIGNNAFLNGSQWQQLIESYLPHLKQWTVVFIGEVNPDSLQTFYAGEFWSSKKSKMKTTVNKTYSGYPSVKSISFGKEWHFGYIDDEF